MSHHFNWKEPTGHEPDSEGDGQLCDTEPACERTPQQGLRKSPMPTGRLYLICSPVRASAAMTQAQVSTSLTAQMLLRIQRSLKLRLLLSSLRGCHMRTRL